MLRPPTTYSHSIEKVSIITPLYNSEKYIQKCIDSVLNQTYTNWELIIVNDGSTDRSYQIAKTYADKYDSITLINQKNKGAATSRNVGFAHSKGSYIQYLDSDDILDKNKIEIQMKKMRSLGNPEDVVVSSSWKLIKEDLIADVSTNNTSVWKDYETPIDILCDFYINKCCFPPGVFLLPRKLVEKTGGWDERLSLNDDGEFMARVYSLSKKIVFCHDANFYYRSTPSSLSKTMSRRAAMSQIESIISTCEIIKKSSNPQSRIAIFKVMEYSLHLFFPYYKSCRKKGENYLSANNYNLKELSYPWSKLNWKEWMYFLLHKELY